LKTTLLLVLLGVAISLGAGDETTAAPAGMLPLWLKIAYTLFLCVLAPCYWWYYGPSNFLWFSDIALLVTGVAMWLESPFLASTQAVSVALLEMAWNLDFLVRLITGVHIIGISRYMFKKEIPLFMRGLSLFHVWLPFLLVWLVCRLGYDSRAWLAQSMLAVVVLSVCFVFSDRASNINWVFGPGEKAQTRMPAGLYFLALIIVFTVGVYLPTHFLLQWLCPARGSHL
jgi:hypothetical protein